MGLYDPIKGVVLTLLRAPKEPPEPPAGDHTTVDVYRASKRFLTYRLVAAGLVGLLVYGALAIGFVAASIDGETEGMIAMGALAGVTTFVLMMVAFTIRVDYDLRYYVITDRSMRVREGAIIVKEKTLTYANVQNLELKQGPLQRLLGISDLEVHVAGGGAAEGKNSSGGHLVTIAGVDNAREIREQVRAFLGRSRDSGLGDMDDHEQRAAGPGNALDPQATRLLREILEEATLLRRAAG